MKPWFIWNDTDSRTLGIIIREYPPIVLPGERVEQITVPGRAGCLIRTQGEAIYEPYLKTFDIANASTADPQPITAWLRGSGTLIVGSEPEFAYEARVVKEAQMKRQFPGVWAGSVGFLVQPFKRLAQQCRVTPIDLTGQNPPTTWSAANIGDVPAHPRITLTGSGEVSVTVNGDRGATIYVNLTGTDCAGVVIDTDAMAVTDDTGTVNLNARTSITAAGFPGLWLPAGGASSTISWSGTLSAVTIDPRWRWL